MAYTNIDDPSAHFQTALYTGNNTADTSITNDGNSNLQPDWIWIKRRDGSADHNSFDSSRGTGAHLAQNQTQAEQTVNGVTAFESDGFQLSTNNDSNINGGTFVAWQWKANGGTTSTNTDGDIDSTVQVNQDAGFSIVTDSPTNNTARSIGHGLGVAPQVVIRRARTRIESWRVFHSAAGSTGGLTLNSTTTYNSSTTLFTGVTSTTFGVGTDFSVNGNYSYVSYCFAEKQGYSKFGSYVGNGNANGPFVYTGFKPAFVMIKKSNSTGQWLLFDNARDPSNKVFHQLRIITAAESTITHDIDFLSNGFKIRDIVNNDNGSGDTFIYMAFAENPFVTSTGIPTTAR